uniref:Uncharacterized protein n=1 Tax=Oryza meridionalis TaxID=40149 RepID=A0A0E0ESN8_9ORYZ
MEEIFGLSTPRKFPLEVVVEPKLPADLYSLHRRRLPSRRIWLKGGRRRRLPSPAATASPAVDTARPQLLLPPPAWARPPPTPLRERRGRREAPPTPPYRGFLSRHWHGPGCRRISLHFFSRCPPRPAADPAAREEDREREAREKMQTLGLERDKIVAELGRGRQTSL